MLRPRTAVLLLSAITASTAAVGAEYKPGEVIVKYKEGVMRARLESNSLYQTLGVTNVQRFSGIMRGYERLVLKDNTDVQTAIAALSKHSYVAYAQPNYILRALPVSHARAPRTGGVHVNEPCWFPGIPFPPGCDDSGGGGGNPVNPPHEPGEPGGGNGGGASRPQLNDAPAEVNPPVQDPDLALSYGIEKVGATEAWKEFRGSKDFIVADIDTGIDYNHDDLSFNLWRNPNPDATAKDVVGYDFVHGDGLPFDDNEHGSHTAGTIAAVGGNGVGTSGVVQKVSLMSIKFLSGQGEGTTADAIRSIDYAVQHGARVLSNSWGGPGDSENNALKEAVERARAKDVLFVAAAGNDGANNDTTPSYPAAFDNDNMITVAATDRNDKLAYFSNYGKTTVHLAAPGVEVYSTVPGNKYSKLSGTSMACPHVAGAAALVWSKHPEWTYKQVKDVLMKTVDPIAGLEGKTISGGRMNVLKALQASN